MRHACRHGGAFSRCLVHDQRKKRTEHMAADRGVGGMGDRSGVHRCPGHAEQPCDIPQVPVERHQIIRVKVGLVELAKQLGNISQACKMLGYSRDSF